MANNLTTILCRCHEIWGTLTSWNTLGHSGPVTGLIYLYLYVNKIGRHLNIIFNVKTTMPSRKVKGKGHPRTGHGGPEGE